MYITDSRTSHKLMNRSIKDASTPATNGRIPAEKTLPHQLQMAECQKQTHFHAGLKRPSTSSKDAPTQASNDRMPAAKMLPYRPHKAEYQQRRCSHIGLKRPNISSKDAPTSASNDRMLAAKIMIFTKRHNKMPKKPPPEEKESLQAYVRLQASLMIKPVWSWSIKPLRESQQLPRREPL